MTTTIYKTSGTYGTSSSPSTPKSPETNQDWNLRGFYPKGFFTPKKDPMGVHGLLVHDSNNIDWFQWVYPTCQFQRGNKANGDPKWVPFDYKKLLARFCPVFLFCYWDSTTQSIIQIDRRALHQTGVVRTRHMNINQFRSYIYTQVKQVSQWIRGHEDPNELILRVFNDSWFGGKGVYPLRFTKQECEGLLPHWNEQPEGFFLMEPEIKYIPQRSGEPIPKLKLHFKLYNMHTTKNIPLYIKAFENRIGCSFTPDSLQDLLDELAYRPGVRKGRVTTIIRELKDEGIELKRRKVWLDNKAQNMYFVNRMTASELKEYSQQIA